jgi:hypothetical protein
MRERWFPHKVHKIAPNYNKWPEYEKEQLSLIKQCVNCQRNYVDHAVVDNDGQSCGCPYPINKEPNCKFKVPL